MRIYYIIFFQITSQHKDDFCVETDESQSSDDESEHLSSASLSSEVDIAKAEDHSEEEMRPVSETSFPSDVSNAVVSVVMVMRPPFGIASRALTHRFIKTCSI